MSMHAGYLERGIESRLLALSGDVPPGSAASVRSLGALTPYSVKVPALLAAALREPWARDAQIVHAHLFPSQLYVSLLARLMTKALLITTEHNTSNRRRNKRLWRPVDGAMYHSYQHVACVSHGTREALIRWQPRLESRVSTIYDGIQLSRFKNTPRGPRPGPPLIVSVGSLTEQKNYETTIAALANLRELEFRYQIAGEGPLRKTLQRSVDSLGMADKVKLIGHHDDVAELLASADLFVLYSKWEGFGLAVVEAMASGLPVVVANVPGLNEIVSHKEHGGVPVPPNRPDLLSAAIRLLLVDVDQRRLLAEHAVERSQAFDIETMIDSYTRLYRSLM